MRRKIVKQKRQPPSTRWREVGGILLIVLGVFVFLSLISYDPHDISFYTAQPNDPPHNYIGLVGAWFSFVAFFLIGFSSFLFPVLMMFLGIRSIFKETTERFSARAALVLMVLLSGSCLLELYSDGSFSSWGSRFGLKEMGPGGFIGQWVLRKTFVRWVGREGSYILLYSMFLAGLVLLLDLKLSSLGRFLGEYSSRFFKGLSKKAVEWGGRFQERLRTFEFPRRKRPRPVEISISGVSRNSSMGFENEEGAVAEKVKKWEPPKRFPPLGIAPTQGSPLPARVVSEKGEKETRVQLELLSSSEYQLPSVKLLDEMMPSQSKGMTSDDLKRNAEILKNTLAEFDVEVEVVNVTHGPVITRYELQPAPGVKVQKITGLSNDIALAMKVGAVRMVAPIPGKAAVGVEVPNLTSVTVSLKEILTSDEFKNTRKRIPLALGKDVSGVPIVADLTEMPHLLIAGATGSGKSVCMNSIILSILFYASPEYLRFLLIDPKMVELSVFKDIPHLAIPVITDPKKAAAGLGWLVTEMERRYKILAEVGVRNIEIFNEKVIQEKITLKSDEAPLKPLPYIVVVVDELADIMLVASYEVENSIARLAQLSRAIGVHLILATQRPSVDVITGVIKANFPARISFQVSSRVDSRTVIDTMGAEKLLGRGDMLFMPPGSSKLIRAQGANVRDSELKKVLEFIKSQKVSFSSVVNPAEILEKAQALSSDLNPLDDESLLKQAIQVIRNTGQASVSVLQRKLRIGYSRAARMMDLLEEQGIVGPYKGSKARDILIDIEEEAGA
ncbi:MAG: DNA translocase FtsK [Chlamydiae bacterium]|nr:DNA translocase FtsK [Chlamydiota bacterium]MBI3265759.1 DNA translocase FtsK [Chlamydiota bacterium]